MTKWIALTGLGGSGKTTTLTSIGVDDGYINSPAIKTTFQGVHSLKSFLIPLLPFYYVLHSWLDTRQHRYTDRSYMDRFVSLAVHKKLSSGYLKIFLEFLPKPDYLVYLKITPEVAFERKHEHPIEFIQEEEKIIEDFAETYMPNRVVWIDALKHTQEDRAAIILKMMHSLETYGDIWAEFIFDRDYSILPFNRSILFEKCWNNRMIYHYFDLVPNIWKMKREFIKNKTDTILFLKQKYPNIIILEKAKYDDIESDIDVCYIEKEIIEYKLPLPIDQHYHLNYFGAGFVPKQISEYHAAYETGTCIMRDYTEKMDKYFAKGEFPRKLSVIDMLVNSISHMSLSMLINYTRVLRAWRKGELPYYCPEHPKRFIHEVIMSADFDTILR